MEDSVKVIRNGDYTRSVGKSIYTPQRVRKGFTTPAVGSTIPSKYQTYVTVNRERKSFNSSAARFGDQLVEVNDVPGPAAYEHRPNLGQESVSLSKKGTGPLASKSPRFRNTIRGNTIGPGSYAPPTTEKKLNFSTAQSSSVFMDRIVKVKDKSALSPGPGTYSIPLSEIDKGKGATSAFRSKTSRVAVDIQKQRMPSPSKYYVTDNGMKRESKSYNSVFKSTSNRSIMKLSHVPGPADYEPYGKEGLYNDKKILPPKHYQCLSAPAIPPSPPPPLPGPGSYELRDFSQPTKHFMSTSSFTSGTSRWMNGGIKDTPGPGAYKPEIWGKQSFHENVNKKWI
ncbi:O(6)-methylguanine-induced apoptosis 2 [Trichoplax sp. H2]|uniref:O(6)-methylguanine-induced apoptosis 2 n=1 Tax=Trichoplax adhaerens TaxID=10228 RepID=B3S188_TRIAD|nr:hypothetical protein TRIADDRAFT_58238 [Trichoplax adhaerens]EDV23521.1 hypothetical protein TRIADDRAFT_58238 [Trichoplax adhaerens]RDD43281.1 O(6)-methylguanine-induced apoptosis 2 [Trichoplax sp. H2]|eukprot:XP_002114431.1 hypothetical protein TRIADDRAFT_58238 [Trichoplax adhaerens]